RARPKRVGRKIAIAGDGFDARAATKEADDGVPGSQRAERPEFEGSGEGRRAGKRAVRTFPCTLPRLAASSTLSMRTDFLVGTPSPWANRRLSRITVVGCFDCQTWIIVRGQCSIASARQLRAASTSSL